jgi:hypothetical protein
MQALFLVNGPFARAQSAMFAKAALGAATDDDARIDWIWRQALLREPSVSERDAARRWLAAAGAQESDTASILPWQGLCQALLASNEFAYID